MTVTAVRACDVVVDAESFADANRDCFFAAIKVRQAGHEGARVEFVHLLFKQTDAHHLPIRTKPFLVFGESASRFFRFGSYGTHCFLPPAVTGVVTPDMAASTSNMQAKSYLVQPMPRAAVRNSLLTAVVGSGTSS